MTHTDLNTEEITALLRAAPVYRKGSIVHIRKGKLGEEVTTQDKHGRTTNTVKDDDSFVVTNPGGENYVVQGSAKIAQKYDDLGGGLYRAKGLYRLVSNPTGGPVSVLAPWGEEQTQGADCFIATQYFPDEPAKITSDRYLLGWEEFRDNNYEVVDVSSLV